jgi:putative acetyltransferase
MPFEVKIRKGREGDGNKLAEIFLHSVLALAPSHYNDKQIRAWVSRVNGERFEHRILQVPFIVAEKADGQPVGFAALNPVSTEVEYVYVHPEAARNGVGFRLMADIEEMARAEGLDRVYLIGSLNAEEFYAHCGFQVDQRMIRMLEGIEIPCVRMSKELV